MSTAADAADDDDDDDDDGGDGDDGGNTALPKHAGAEATSGDDSEVLETSLMTQTRSDLRRALEVLQRRLRAGDLRLTYLDVVYPQHSGDEVLDDVQAVVGKAASGQDLKRVDIGMACSALLYALRELGPDWLTPQFVRAVVGPHTAVDEAALLSTLGAQDEAAAAAALAFLGEVASVVSRDAGSTRFDTEFAAEKKKKKKRFRVLRRLRLKGRKGGRKRTGDGSGDNDAESDRGSAVSFASTIGNAPGLGDACNQLATATAPMMLPVEETDIDVEMLDFEEQGARLSRGLRVASRLEDLFAGGRSGGGNSGAGPVCW